MFGGMIRSGVVCSTRWTQTFVNISIVVTVIYLGGTVYRCESKVPRPSIYYCYVGAIIIRG